MNLQVIVRSDLDVIVMVGRRQAWVRDAKKNKWRYYPKGLEERRKKHRSPPPHVEQLACSALVSYSALADSLNKASP